MSTYRVIRVLIYEGDEATLAKHLEHRYVQGMRRLVDGILITEFLSPSQPATPPEPA